MSWNDIARLIKSDPVTCARHFDFMFHDGLKSSLDPTGKIEDYFYRIEHRFSPHSQALIWVKHAPQYEKDSNKKVIGFVDKYVTRKLDKSEDMKELDNLQLHRHAKTCRVKGKNICAFNFSLPPMRKTIILRSLPTDRSTDEVTEHKKTME